MRALPSTDPPPTTIPMMASVDKTGGATEASVDFGMEVGAGYL